MVSLALYEFYKCAFLSIDWAAMNFLRQERKTMVFEAFLGLLI